MEEEKKSCCERFKEEFRGSKWTLKSDNPHEFYMCQWQRKESKTVHPVYMVYRIIFAVSFILMSINSYMFGISYNKPIPYKLKWFIYVTNWSYMVITAQGILGMIIVIAKYAEQKKNKDSTHSVLCSIYWVLHGIALDVAPNVTIIYWGFVHDPKLYTMSFSNISVHMLNTVLMLVDFWLVAFPTRLVHCYFTCLYALVYICFNIIYCMSGGTDWFDNKYIYDILDWNKDLGLAVMWSVGVFIFVIVFRFIFFGLYLLREKTYYLIYKQNRVEPEPEA